MLPQAIQYRIPDDWDLDQLKAKLATKNRLIEADTHSVKQTYLDSFDWQIWRSGAELSFEQTKQGKRLCWVERNT